MRRTNTRLSTPGARFSCIENGRALLNRGLSLGFDAARELLLDEVGEDVVVKVEDTVFLLL